MIISRAIYAFNKYLIHDLIFQLVSFILTSLMEILIFAINLPPKSMKSTPVIDVGSTVQDLTGTEAVAMLDSVDPTESSQYMQKFDAFYTQTEKHDPLSTNLIDIFLCYKETGDISPNSSMEDFKVN